MEAERMTIDEQIISLRNHDLLCHDSDLQIAEWLEELKLFKELYPDTDIKSSLVTNYNNGWNDGIDELIDGLCCQACFTNAQKDAIRKLAEEFKNES